MDRSREPKFEKRLLYRSITLRLGVSLVIRALFNTFYDKAEG